MNIAVTPSHRRNGLGSYLLIQMINTGISHGMRRAWLEVRPSNRAARRLYEKAGFKEIDRRPRYYNDTNEDAIVMSLSLSQDSVGSRRASDRPPMDSLRQKRREERKGVLQ